MKLKINDNMIIVGTPEDKCPTCEGRMPIHIYAYANPYHYCPYCGEKLEEGAVMKWGQRLYGWKEDA